MRMRDMTSPSRRFKIWWKYMKSKENSAEEIENWLKFACKTMAMRGDQDQQRVVYTIATRFRRSTYKRLSSTNAWKVYKMVNHKQENFKREKAKIHRLLNQLEHQANKPSTFTQRTKTRKIITGSSGNVKT